MPIRLNFLAEDLEQEELRRKNPVKQAIWVCGFVLFLVMLWGLTLFFKTIVVNAEASALETKWKQMENSVKQAEEARKRKRDVEGRLSALTQFTTNRFFWATALDSLQQTCVDNVELVRLKVEQVYGLKEAAKAPVAAPSGPVPVPATQPAAPAKPALASERIVVALEGRDYGARAGEQVPRYKETLLGFPYFQAHLQRTNSIQLTSLSAPQVDAARKVAYVQFGLQLNFQEKERRLYE
jgi:hypothetical protein